MKKLFVVFLLICGINCFAQIAVPVSVQAEDSTKKQIAIVVGGNSGAGFSFNRPSASSNYGELVMENNVYLHRAFHVGFLMKEKMGFRFNFGRLGLIDKSTDFFEYTQHQYTQYHYLHEYSDLTAGYSYLYFTPQASFRLGSEPFNFTASIGIGVGKLETGSGIAVLQENASNNFLLVEYISYPKWCSHQQLTMEFGYMRQLSQHFFMNAGVYAEFFVVDSLIDFDLYQTEYAQPRELIDEGGWQGRLVQLHTGIFLQFQWNKRESPRAYYE